MSRIARAFLQDRLTFIPYLVAGDPDPDTTLRLATTLADAGADILELGVPFSDPMADGPTISRGHERARAAGMTTQKVFTTARNISKNTEIPIILFTYYNPVFRKGIASFYEQAHHAGVEGMLIVDMPPEESEEAMSAAREYDIDQIFLVAPTTTPTRMDYICERAGGFLYLVSALGVTGTRDSLSPEVGRMITMARKRTTLPLAVGFGISGPLHVRAAGIAGADGVIVGSALVGIIEQNLHSRDSMLREMDMYARSLQKACMR